MFKKKISLSLNNFLFFLYNKDTNVEINDDYTSAVNNSALNMSKTNNSRVKKSNKQDDDGSGGGQAQQRRHQSVDQRKRSARATKNITRMVVFQALLNVTGTAPYIIYFILVNSDLVAVTQQFLTYAGVSLIFLYCTPGLNIFIYYFFNKLYKKVLKSYFKKIFFFI
jgi:hypothetical protein